MRILGIETSCDETSAAVLEESTVLSNVVLSQEVHRDFGGVVPEVASRAHIKAIVPILERSLLESKTGLDALDSVAVTLGPGLIGSLIVGLGFAKSLSYAWQKPLVGVDHVESHIAAVYLGRDAIDEPFVSLVVSGGHTHLFLVEKPAAIRLVGCTRDDAAGEAFDKVARMLGLAYPGGPEIEREAREGDPKSIDFPRAAKVRAYEFSFSGLKTAVRYYIDRQKGEITPGLRADIAASFQEAVVDVLVDKTLEAARNLGVRYISAVGGVASNHYLRGMLRSKAEASGFEALLPEPEFCTDNAAIVAMSGLLNRRAGKVSDLSVAPYSTRRWPQAPLR